MHRSAIVFFFLLLTHSSIPYSRITGTDAVFESTLAALQAIPAGEHDYLLTAKAVAADGKPIATAKLKLVNLPSDNTLRSKKSDYYEITLAEYTLSDNYMLFLQ